MNGGSHPLKGIRSTTAVDACIGDAPLVGEFATGGVVGRGDGPVVGEGSVPEQLPDAADVAWTPVTFESVKVLNLGPESRLFVSIRDDNMTPADLEHVRSTVAAWAGIAPDRVLLGNEVDLTVVEPEPAPPLMVRPVAPQFDRPGLVEWTEQCARIVTTTDPDDEFVSCGGDRPARAWWDNGQVRWESGPCAACGGWATGTSRHTGATPESVRST